MLSNTEATPATVMNSKSLRLGPQRSPSLKITKWGLSSQNGGKSNFSSKRKKLEEGERCSH